MRARRLWSSIALVSSTLAFGGIGAAACTAAGVGQSGAFSEGDGGSTASKPSGSGSTGGGSGEGGIQFTGGTGGDTGEGGGCAGEETQAEQIPLDMYVMLDQSGSMSTNDKWGAVTTALKSFVQQTEAAGIGVGIQYFGLPVGGTTCRLVCTIDSQCGANAPCEKRFPLDKYKSCKGCTPTSTDSCSATDYSNPEVEIAPLPGSAVSIIDSINSHGPTRGTPTSAALQGAIDHAKAWQIAHPDHVAIAVLATDGFPELCDDNLDNINLIAEGGFTGTPSIRTFVVGVGNLADALNGFAEAGGTTQAFIIDNGPTVTADFLAAMNAIRGTALPCSFKIPLPDSGTPDYNRVNVKYTPGAGGTGFIVPKVADAASCPLTGDGWYYNDNANPTLIEMCPTTCQTLKVDTDGKVNILTGCKTILQ